MKLSTVLLRGKWLLYGLIWLLCQGCYFSRTSTSNYHRHTPHSTTEQALAYLHSLGVLPVSKVWPNISPVLFMKNVETNVSSPGLLYQGTSTNFCSYAALSYILISNDPLGYARTVVELYLKGQAYYGSVKLFASKAIRRYAGTFQLKGKMDICPADQLWFLTLVDNFKGYLNVLDMHYDPGNENTLWAATNYAKFNGMARNLLGYKTTAFGSDLIHPSNIRIVEQVQEMQKRGYVVLFFDHERAYKRTSLRFAQFHMPTHFIVVKKISYFNNTDISIRYWDYGSETEQSMPLSKFRNIVYGTTLIEKR
jgi:hypothetical protein